MCRESSETGVRDKGGEWRRQQKEGEGGGA